MTKQTAIFLWNVLCAPTEGSVSAFGIVAISHGLSTEITTRDTGKDNRISVRNWLLELAEAIEPLGPTEGGAQC